MNYYEPVYHQTFFPYSTNSSSTFQTKADVVYIWRASYQELLKASNTLKKIFSSDERCRAFSYADVQRREYYYAGRLFLRSVLAEHTGIKPNRLIFLYSKAGKPFLDQSQNRQKLYFNLTHSKEFLLLAVTYGRDLGLDLEYIRPVYQPEMIARRFFTETEQRELDLVSLKDRDEIFMKFWVRREAYLKLHGLGVSSPNKKYSSSDENTAASSDFIQVFRPTDNYIAALALAGSQIPMITGYHFSLPVKPVRN